MKKNNLLLDINKDISTIILSEKRFGRDSINQSYDTERNFYEDSARIAGFFLNLKYITINEISRFLLYHGATDYMISDKDFLTKVSFFFSLFKNESCILYLVMYLSVFDLYYLFTSNIFTHFHLVAIVREFNLAIDKLYYMHNVRKKLLQISDEMRRTVGGDMRLLFYKVVFKRPFMEDCLIEVYVVQAVSSLIMTMFSIYDEHMLNLKNENSLKSLVNYIYKVNFDELKLKKKLKFLNITILHEFNLFYKFILYKFLKLLKFFILGLGGKSLIKKKKNNRCNFEKNWYIKSIFYKFF